MISIDETYSITPITTPITTPMTTPMTTPIKDVEIKKQIILLIKENNTISATELAKIVGISRDGVRYHLNKLKLEGIIKHCGSTKSGYWEVKDYD